MAQARKKQATRTKKAAARGGQARKKAATRTRKQKQITQSERMHIYVVTAMAMIAGILLCANAAMMIV